MNLSCFFIAYIYVIYFSHYLHSISSLFLSLFPFSLSIYIYIYISFSLHIILIVVFLCVIGNKLYVLRPINFEFNLNRYMDNSIDHALHTDLMFRFL